MFNMDNYMSSSTIRALAVIGLLYLSARIFSFVRLLFSLFVLPGIPLSKFGRKDSWAIITGASDGIGAEFSKQLAARGYNLLLISRTQSKLDALARDLESKHGIQTKTYAMDFSLNRDPDYAALSSLLSPLDIAILVNNVGQSHSIPVPFVQTSRSEMDGIIAINCVATLRVTQLVAPQLVRRKHGLILTISSFGGLIPTPLLATYSGSKAFLSTWSSALGAELAPHGVTVHCVQSYMVVSAMSKIRRASAMVPSPKRFVGAVLAKVGRSGACQGLAYQGTPYWAHAAMQWLVQETVGLSRGVVLEVNRRMHEGIRKRALRKMEREGRKAE